MIQSTNNILLVRPANFGYNDQTSVSNAFQKKIVPGDGSISEKAIREFDSYVKILRSNNIAAYIVQDTDTPIKPDAIFPNNWASFHHDGTVVLYPMEAPNRRSEKREAIIDRLKESFLVKKIIDLSHYEQQNKFCEGTGSIIFDHIHKIAYAGLSSRTNPDVLSDLCNKLKYKPITFKAFDNNNIPIYHTNVMMSVSKHFAVVCLESITNKEERKNVIHSLEKTEHEIIDISFHQVKQFAGNMLSVINKEDKEFLIMSKSAYSVLTSAQINILSRFCELLPINIETIETVGGGSARCMICEIFLPPKMD